MRAFTPSPWLRGLLLALLTVSTSQAANSSIYTIGGNQIEVSAAPEKPVATLGEAVSVSLIIANRGPGAVIIIPPIEEDQAGSYWKPSSLLQVSNAEGKPVGVPLRPAGSAGSFSGPFPVTIPAGGSYTKGYLLSVWAAIDEPGTYRLRAHWSPRWTDTVRPSSRGNSPDRGTPLVLRAETEIRIEPASDAEKARQIALLGESAIGTRDLDGFNEAFAKLNQVDDERVLPYLRRLIHEAGPGNNGPVRQAFSALSKFTSDEALTLLMEGVNFQMSALPARFQTEQQLANVRNSALNALAASKHPQAFARLSAYRKDPTPNVRNVVVRAAAHQHPSVALPVLREMAGDPVATHESEIQRLIGLMSAPGFVSAADAAAAAAIAPRVVRRDDELIVRYDARPADLASFRNERGIRTLRFSREGTGPLTYLTAPDLVTIAGWTDLTSFDFGPIPPTDEAFAHLVRLNRLETIARGPSGLSSLGLLGWLSESGLASVGRLESLQEVNLVSSPFRPEALAALAPLRGLRSLGLGSNATDDTLEIFRHNAALESLALSNSAIGESGMITVGAFKKLKQLTLVGTPLSAGGAAALASLPELASIRSDQLTDAAMDALSAAPVLTSLLAGRSLLTEAAIPAIARLKGLQEIELGWTAISRIPGGLSEVTRLSLGSTPVDDAGLAALGDYRKLQALDLTSTRITDAGLARIGELQELRNLQVGSTAITDVSLEAIAKLTKLESLNLSNTRVTKAGLARLAGLGNLRILNLTGLRPEISRQEAEAIIPSLQR